MPQHAQDQARIVSVRLPADLLQRLDRVLDWQATARQRPATRHAAIREALCAWLDDHEQRAGLVEPQRVVYLSPADNSPRLTRRLSQGLKVLDGWALMTSQQPSEPW